MDRALHLGDVTDCSFSPLIKRRLKYTGVITFYRKNNPNPWKIISKMVWIGKDPQRGRVSGAPHFLVWKNPDPETAIKDLNHLLLCNSILWK